MLCTMAHAHSLYFTLSDDGENTVEMEALFSTGALAAGATVRLYDKQGGKVIWKGKTDEYGTCIFQRPDVPYEVELDAGPGHQSRGDGI